MPGIDPTQATVLSPRGDPNSPTYGGPISGTDLLKLRDTSLHFRYEHMPVKQGVPKTLIVPHCNAIKWSYTLNTNVQSTYGGEVIQALSCYAGPITITGQVADHYLKPGDRKSYQSAADELLRIYTWFRIYMIKAAGAGKSVKRDETAMLFTYPERGWSLWIQPTALRSFAFGTERLGQEWSIEAEVMTDNDLNYFSKATMNSFTDTLLEPTLVTGNKLGIGLPGDPRTDPTVNARINAQRFGDNFQALVGAWSSGDFAHWGFNELTSADQNGLTADPSSYWRNLFGSDSVALGAGSGGSVVFGGGSTGNTSTQAGIVFDINAAFSAAGIPGDIAVADALHESGLDPDSRATNDGGPGIDGVGLYQVHAPGGAKDTQMIRAASSGAGRDKAVTDTYPVGTQITDAVGWWSATLRSNPGLNMTSDDDKAQLAMRAENPGAGAAYANAVLALLPQARDLIKGSTAASGGGNYVNPLSGISNLLAERIDQGVDYAGAGQIVALGPGRISFYSQLGGSVGWPEPGNTHSGGAFLSYTLSDGPAKGLTVYIAENISLASFGVGDVVEAGQVLGTLNSAWPNMETGWARPGEALAMAADVYNEGDVTAFGVNFSELLESLGAPGGTGDRSSAKGTLPAGWPKWK